VRSDLELLGAWRGNDRQAGDELIERHFDALFRFLRNKLDEPAEDLVQKVFLECIAHRDPPRDGGSFRAYLFRIARSELYDHFERRRRDDEPTDFASMSIQDLGPTPSAVAVDNQQQRVLVTALRRIPVDFQVLLELHYWESLTARELAEVLEVPVDTLENRLRRGKQLLRYAAQEVEAGVIPVAASDDDLDAWAESLRACLAVA
jgi:RNA polymerase sigma-70 factor (ECF subfamily)